MKIAVYINNNTAKANYKNENYNTRKNVGIAVVEDILRRAGHQIHYASSATVNQYDVILASMTADCDIWQFIRERAAWSKGNYKVLVGGAGILNVRPVLRFADYYLLGRAEGVISELINGTYQGDSVIETAKFNVDKKYYINQVDCPYSHEIELSDGTVYQENQIGCNHKCLFCNYTWSRKFVGGNTFQYRGLWSKNEHVERAMLDMHAGVEVDLQKLRTTAIDGYSERLRRAVNKPITREMLRGFVGRIGQIERPHQFKIYNVCGYPTETENDMLEFLEDIKIADADLPEIEKGSSILLHNTPFRPMPATPLACEPAQFINQRGRAARILGSKLKGNLIYQGNAIWAVEGMGVESLATHIESMIIHRGTEDDMDNVERIALSKKYKNANAVMKVKFLDKYFNLNRLFGRFDANTLPSRYIRTYAKVENEWGKNHFEPEKEDANKSDME